MGFVQGKGRTQVVLLPVTLEQTKSARRRCRVIDAFVDRLDIAGG